MPGYKIRPESLFAELRRNLSERYAGGFTIVKELLQNADDAGATHLVLSISEGWPRAHNPLLRGPGLLAINDGVFTAEHLDGIFMLGLSVKADDHSSIGRFGFGQKALFHLCDAFIIDARGHGVAMSDRQVVNPFLGLDDHAPALEWEKVTEDDRDIFADECARYGFENRSLALWIPFRRNDLKPVLTAHRLSAKLPTVQEVASDCRDATSLKKILSTLRNVRDVRIDAPGEASLHVKLADGAQRLRGPKGCIPNEPHAILGKSLTGWMFVGQERLTTDPVFIALENNPHWPQVDNPLGDPTPEKAAAHGAVTITFDAGEPPRADRCYAVFLPVGETDTLSLPGGATPAALPGAIHISLHGYFFLNSGRTAIDGFDGHAGNSDAAAILRQEWNAAIRDRVTLPLIPRTVRALLDERAVDTEGMSAIVGAIAGSDFFGKHRASICSETALVRNLEPSGSAVWRCVTPDMDLRPLPDSVIKQRQVFSELFPDFWTSASQWLPVVSRSMLCVREPAWRDHELAALVDTIPASLVFRDAAVSLLNEILAQPRGPGPETGTAIVRLVKRALKETTSGNLASSSVMKDLLRTAAQELLFQLPATVTSRRLLAALASADATLLPVRAEWLDQHDNPQVADDDVAVLLAKLEPLIESDGATSEQALTASTAIIGAARSSAGRLASNPDIRDLRVLRAHDPRLGRTVPVSLGSLASSSRLGLLFTRPPGVPGDMPGALARALPSAPVLTVDGPVANALRDGSSPIIDVQTPRPEALVSPILSAETFGAEADRVALLALLLPPGHRADKDVQRAARALAIGQREAAQSNARIIRHEPELAGIWTLLRRLTAHQGQIFWAPSAGDLSDNAWSSMGVERIAKEDIGNILLQTKDDDVWREVDEAACDSLVLSGLPDSALRQLPIHPYEDGVRGPITIEAVAEGALKIPANLRTIVRVLRSSDNPAINSLRQRLAGPWTLERQIGIALSSNAPSLYRQVVLDALAAIGSIPEGLEAQLRAAEWLMTPTGPVAPKEILVLSSELAQALREAGKVELTLTDELEPEIREHAAFPTLQRLLLSNQESLAYAALMLPEGLVGYLAGLDAARIADLRILANASVDLALPGWRIIAAALKDGELSGSPELIKFLDVFSVLHQTDANSALLAADHLDALADAAAQRGRIGEAALGMYRLAFEAVAKWPKEGLPTVFAKARVLTADGVWRTGREVVESGDGVSLSHRLDRSLADFLVRQRDDGAQRLETHHVKAHTGQSNNTLELDARSAVLQREFLETWKGRVPADLVVLYLGLVGRYPALRDLADEWAGANATKSVDAHWEALDEKVSPGAQFPLAQLVAARRFLINLRKDRRVQAISLSGEVIDVPTGSTDSILLGNRHQKGEWRGDYTVHHLEISNDIADAGVERGIAAFRRFIVSVAEDCHGLFMDRERNGLKDLLDQACQLTQTTIRDTAAMLKERLPTIVEQMKPAPHMPLGQAQKRYRDAEQRFRRSDDTQESAAAKERLWDDLQSDEAAEHLLILTRQSINEVGYRPERVLYELLQNADDAYAQLTPAATGPLIVENDGAILRIIHWGRPINDLGPKADQGREAGYDRDLLNMLVRNVSEKRHGDNVTGQFGLGFKSVHLLASEVRVVSDLLSVRIRGGLIPLEWAEGPDVAKRYRSETRAPTVIEMVIGDQQEEAANRAKHAFAGALPWLPALARRVQRISLRDAQSEKIATSETRPLVGDGISLIDGPGLRALRLHLQDGYSIFLRLGTDGVVPIEENTPRLWRLAPLEEDIRAGWLIDGPFPIDPGRTGIAGLAEERAKIFVDLGDGLAFRLTELFDVAMKDWGAFASRLGLSQAAKTPAGAEAFWASLHKLFAPDSIDETACLLHKKRSGYAAFAQAWPVVPTRLPAPFNSPVSAGDVEHWAGGALIDPDVFKSVSTWPALRDLTGSIVSAETARELRAFGFDAVPYKLANLLRAELLKRDFRVDKTAASVYGRMLNLDNVNEERMSEESYHLKIVAREAKFLAVDGQWRSSSELSAPSLDPKIPHKFAPARALLDHSYEESLDAMQFFAFARALSGYSPKPQTYAAWAQAAPEDVRREVVYFLTTDEGRTFADALHDDWPSWLPRSSEALQKSEYLLGLSEEDKNKLVVRLLGYRQEIISTLGHAWRDPTPPQTDPASVLEAIFEWWADNRSTLIEEYSTAIYPTGYQVSALSAATDPEDAEDREAWFTFLALSTLVNSGRFQPEQHRGFIESGRRQGWWQAIAATRPSDNPQPWLDRLESWSAASLDPGLYSQWRRSLVDLYTIARWLPEYMTIVQKLGRMASTGEISLKDIFNPSSSHLIAKLGIDAAPLSRSLGIGTNWLVRELSRHGFFQQPPKLLAPYSFASTLRLRRLLDRLGLRIEGPAADHSHAIYTFVAKLIGEEKAVFLGDMDLPLQMIMTAEHIGARQIAFDSEDDDGFMEEPTDIYETD